VETSFKQDNQGLGMKKRNKKRFEAQQMLTQLHALAVTTQKPLVNCPMRDLKRRKTVHLNLSYQHFWGSCPWPIMSWFGLSAG
jgi:hypothetical protein